MTSPGRNSPCPCGSGKRYKDCHGALAPTADASPLDDGIRERLNDALTAQQAGRFAKAIELYESVIARHPRTFDALHMLGVTHFQRGEFERAHELVSSALAIRPSAAARHNLYLIESALEHRGIESTICRETLPRLAKRCLAPPEPDGRRRWRDTTPDLIVSRSDIRDRGRELDRLVEWLGAVPTVWLYPQTSSSPFELSSHRVIASDEGAIPMHRIAVFFGAEISPAAWYAQAAATDIALYCDAAAPCVLLDRIPELAREGRTPLHLLYASPELAGRVTLNGYVVDGS